MILPRYNRWLVVSQSQTSHTHGEQFRQFLLLDLLAACFFFCFCFLFFHVSGQVVYLVQSEPKFTDQVTDAAFVVIPGVMKTNGAIHSFPDHCLSPTSYSLVTIYIKGARTIWVDCVYSADPGTVCLQASETSITLLIGFLAKDKDLFRRLLPVIVRLINFRS